MLSYICCKISKYLDMFNLTSRVWFSMVCTLIDNDTRHHSGQKVVDSRGAVAFYHNINVKENVFSEHELRKALRDTLTRAALSRDSYRQRQISQSDCEISSNCGKAYDCIACWYFY